jgi:cytochrome c peroxidase
MSVARIVGVLVMAVGVGVTIWWWPRDGARPSSAAVAQAPNPTDLPVTPIPTRLNLDTRKVALGERLFHDRRLSQDDALACAECHGLDQAGQDGRRVAVGFKGAMGSLNSPTVFNSGFNFRQFWDGRVATLEEQAEGPVHNPSEMASNWREVIIKLKRDVALVAEFKAIWPDGVTPANIQGAIAEFERSLTTPDSAFDRYLRGETEAISASAAEGWRLFRDLGCIACHQGVNLGGNMYANLGVMGDYFADRGKPVVKADLGRYNITKRAEDKHVFKVPGLRNIARTAPYFHDGNVATLAEAVALMARYQLGVSLGAKDSASLVAFLESLTGRYRGRAL